MGFQYDRVYAAELGRHVAIRSLSAGGAVRLARAAALPDANARKMALVLETIRDGSPDFAGYDNDALMDFAAKYPQLTARLFMAIRNLPTES